jgi:Nucleotidyl transferase AbiEii toxin, Type IV TA system
MLHLEAVTSDTMALLRRIQALPELKQTRLAGGTALALQLGHRLSIDLDIFGTWDEQLDLTSLLSACGKAEKTAGKTRLQFFEIDGIKVDFITYSADWLVDPLEENGIRCAGIPDIAAMKLEAVNNRGSRKDFMDLAFLLELFTLPQMLKFYKQKYPAGSEYLILRSLVFFDDAEEEPMPVMLKPMNWDTAKACIQNAVRDCGRNM